MGISFDKALGIHQYSVGVRRQRAELLASNLANANTPGYKAKDSNFEQALKLASTSQSMGVTQTHQQHLTSTPFSSFSTQYRTPTQPGVGDGNTVDAQLERNLFIQNALEYQASLDFLSSKFKNLTKALKGQ